LQISSLDKLGEKAVESIDVTIDERLLRLAATFLSSKRSPDEAKIKELVAGLKGVYVKRFVFEREGEYAGGEVEGIRSQLNASTWSKVVGVKSRKGQNVDVYIMSEGSVVKGLAVLAAQPKEITVVNIVGPIDLDKLMQLEGHLGIPRLGLEKQEGEKEAK
jgi:hypothetical protein